MSFARCIIHLDHHKADIVRVNADSHAATTVKSHAHPTPQHNSEVREVHEFFASVCAEVNGLDEILVLGSKTTLSDFKHYVEKHRPAQSKSFVAFEPADHLTENQLIAHGRKFFDGFERLAHGE